MNDLQLYWLIPTLVQVLGVAVIVAVLGFAYAAFVTRKQPIISYLSQVWQLRGLAFGAIVFTVGMGFTRVGWGAKALAISLAVLLAALSLGVHRRDQSYRSQVSRQRISVKAVIITIGQVWLGIFLLLIIIWGVHLGWHAYHLYGLVRGVQSNLDQMQVEDLPPMVSSAAEDIDTIHRDLRPLFPIFNAMQGLPAIGAYLGQVDPLLTYADGLAQAGNEIVTELEPLLAGSADGLSLPERASRVLSAGQAHFAAATKMIEQARTARQSIRPALLPDRFRQVFTMLDERFDLLVAGGQLLRVAPTILGSGQAQNYLVLAQNRDELRATGGFISGIGLVTLKDGKIENFSLGDSYAVDDFTKPYPTPPEALKRFMLADYWVARDANWSPDFPTTARQVEALYTLSTGVETQGVIAFNQLAVRKVLEALGPVQVPGTDTPIAAENVEDYMRQAWAPEPSQGLSQEWWLHRKDFMQQLGNVIIEKVLQSGEQAQLLSLANLMVDLLDQGQLLVYFKDSGAQQALNQAGWDGALLPGDGDYLYLVDSNVGFNKMDSVVTRSMYYRVDLTDLTEPTGEVGLSYQNTAIGNVPCVQMASYGNGTYLDMQQRCYWDYWRVYTPGGAQFQSSTAQPVPADELLSKDGWSGQVESLAGEANTQIFAGLLVLPETSSSQVALTYRLPTSVLRLTSDGQHVYSLRVDVQPGLQGLSFRLEVRLPQNAQVTSSTGEMQTDGTGFWTWQGVLEKSTEWTIYFSQ